MIFVAGDLDGQRVDMGRSLRSESRYSMQPSDWIPEPEIIMLGCRPWPPPPDDPTLKDVCPVCKGGIVDGDDATHCGFCNSASPRIEAKVCSARIGAKYKDPLDERKQARKEAIRKAMQGVAFPERERRRIWFGYVGGIAGLNPNATNHVRECREFLIAIGQLPDFNLELPEPKRGRRRRDGAHL